MRTKLLFRCSKRGLGVSFSNYCDWFEKKRATLSKHHCKNCRYLTDEQVKPETTKKDIKSTSKEAEREEESEK